MTQSRWQLDFSEEDRGFLQGRVGLNARVGFGIVFTFLVFDIVSYPIVAPHLPHPNLWAVQHRAYLTEAAIAAVLLGTALITRRGRLGVIPLYALDGLTTLLVCGGLAVLAWAAPDLPMPLELLIFLAVQLLLFVHAAVVPAPPIRTFLVHAFACLPLVLVAADRAQRFPRGNALETWIDVWGLSVMTLAFAAVSAVVSRVIYGLRLRFREAMRLGQYRLEEKLGEGGMGIVYRAQHGMLRRPTAVKLLPPAKAGERTIARFEREVRQTSRLTHPNTVAIYDFGRTPDGVFYYAMELLDGLDLGRVVAAGGPLPPARVVHVLRQCAGALGEAHELGLVHRDVKPENVILCRRGGVPDVAKVVDFGLVKDLETPEDLHLSRADVLTGTPLYMAPESIAAPHGIDGRADLYALGAVGWFLLVGRPPFEGRSIVEVCAKHLSEPASPPSRFAAHPVPAALDDVILSMLAKEPGARPPTAAAVEARLAACVPLVGDWTRADAEVWWAAHALRSPTVAPRAADDPPLATLTVAVDEPRAP